MRDEALKRIHYSWIILIIAFFSITIAGIVRSSSGVLIVPFENNFGWERSTISFAFTISLLLYGLSGPIMAALIEVIGLKKMMILAMSTLLVGVLLTFFMVKPWQLVLIWGIIIGLGSGLFLTVLSPYIANKWFEKRRGLALGILTASTATGQLRQQQPLAPTPKQVKREMNESNKDALIESLRRKIKRLEGEDKQLRDQLKVAYAEVYKRF